MSAPSGATQYQYCFSQYKPLDQWIRFNPFVPAARISLYSHSVVLAKTLAMLFPNNPVGFDILLQMIRQVYVWAYQIGSGGIQLHPEGFHRLTGEDLHRNPSLAPTFGYFLEVALNVVSGSETSGDAHAHSGGALSQYTLETLEHFRRQFANLRQSALAQVFSPRPGDSDALRPCLSATVEDDAAAPVTLIQLHSWQDDRELNAFCALLFAMLYEQRQSELGERSVAGGPVPLSHVAVIDEAHRIFADTPNSGGDKIISPAREVATLMGHMMAECRALGQGLIVSEQSVGKVHPDALINSATKIVHGVGFGKDKQAVAAALALSPVEQDYLSFLQPGEALALVPGIQQPLYVTVPNCDAALRGQATPLPPTACYVLVGSSVLDDRMLASVEAILDALTGDERFAGTVSVRVVRWPVDGDEPVIVEIATRADGRLTVCSHHEFDDAFIAIEEDASAHLFEHPLALLLIAGDPTPTLGVRMRTLSEHLDLEWIACGLSAAAVAQPVADQAALTIDLSAVGASAPEEAYEAMADAVVNLSAVRGVEVKDDADAAQDASVPEAAKATEDGRFRHHVQNLLDRGQFEAAGRAAQKLDQYAARKVGHSEGGSFYVVPCSSMQREPAWAGERPPSAAKLHASSTARMRRRIMPPPRDRGACACGSSCPWS